MGNVNSHIQVPNAILKQFRDEEDPEKKVWYLDLATGEVKRSASGKLGIALDTVGLECRRG